MIINLRQLLLLTVTLSIGCVPANIGQQQVEQFQLRTGLTPLPVEQGIPGGMTKNHRGYPVLFRPVMGEVWGRYAARMVIGEVGRELGAVGEFLSGSHRSGVGGVAGAPIDRVLSRVIGQPLSFYVVMKHGKGHATRLDVLSSFSTVTPDDPVQERFTVGWRAGSVSAEDPRFAERIRMNKALMERLSNLRSQYIRVDSEAVTFVFAGSEPEWSATLREHGGYGELLTAVMDSLAEIADAIPTK